MADSTLANFWHPIATSIEVTAEPQRFVLLSRATVVYRDDKGPVAFQDKCPHRGAALSGGCLEEGKLTCPYHGLQFNRNGVCTHIPSLPEGTPISTKAQLISYQVKEAYGLIWVAMDDPVEALPGWPDNAWESDGHKVFLVGTWNWATSAGRMIENAMDLSHFNFVHKGFTELSDGPVIKRFKVNKTETGFEYAYEDGHLRREYLLYAPFTLHDRKIVIDESGGETWSDSTDSKIGDTTIITFISAPITKVRTRIYVFVARNHSLDKDDSHFCSGFDTVMEQDRIIVESQRPRRVPISLKDELHFGVPDAASIAYRKWLRGIDLENGFDSVLV